MALYDYVYVDLDKVISLYSQMTGGVVEMVERSVEHSRSADNKRNYDFKVFRHDAGGSTLKKGASKEMIKPHHALLEEMEEALAGRGYMVDLTNPAITGSFRDYGVREQLKNAFCLKARGRVVIEDYERIKGIAGAFPEVVKLINNSAEVNVRASAEYIEAKAKLESAEGAAKAEKNRNARASATQRIAKIRRSLDELLATTSKVGVVDQWVLDGMKTWIDTFLPNIVNIRVYPNVDRPDEHVFGHLKKQYFEDSDTGSFHFTYGSFPTEELTLIGIVTSVPEEAGEQFRPLSEFEKGDLADYESVESAFRGVFRGFDGLEQMIRTCRFPRVLVYPLTVYRSAPEPTTAR
jgi:hypothetical protein